MPYRDAVPRRDRTSLGGEGGAEEIRLPAVLQSSGQAGGRDVGKRGEDSLDESEGQGRRQPRPAAPAPSHPLPPANIARRSSLRRTGRELSITPPHPLATAAAPPKPPAGCGANHSVVVTEHNELTNNSIDTLATTAVMSSWSSTDWSEASGGYTELRSEREPHSRIRVDLFEDLEALGCWGRFTLTLHNAWRAERRFSMFLKLTWTDFRSRKGTYAISFCSVFFVVLLCVAMLSVLSSLPVLFLRLAEPSVGMADLVLRPGGQMLAASSLNYSAIRAILDTYPADTHLHAPRVMFNAYAFTPKECRTRHVADLWFPFPEETNSSESFSSFSGSLASSSEQPSGSGEVGEVRRVCTRTCYSAWCQTQVGPVVTVYALNTTQEDRIGFAPYAEYPFATPKKGFAVISSNVARNLNIGKGDDMFLFADELETSLGQFYAGVPPERRNYHVLLELKVEVVTQTYSYKFPETDNFVLVNYEHLGEMLAEGMSPLMAAEERALVAATQTDSAASAVFFRMPPEVRYHAYVDSNFKTVQGRVRDWGSVVVSALGSNQLAPQTPILTFLRSIKLFSMFVGLIMSLIILALVFLSILLIYSLLTVGIDTRTFELGIQRMIGFTRESLVVMVLTNAYFFTIPAWLCGLAAGQGVYSLLRFVLGRLVEVKIPAAVSGSSIGWATLAGLLIPLVAAIFPILSVVTLRLSDALDAAHSRATGVVFKIKSNDAQQWNGSMLGLGLLFTVFGFLLYYLFPGSLMNQNLSLMFYIFFFVLIGMLAGLVLLATNFQRVVETVLLYVLLFWESRPVFRMVRKSLAAHRLRNRKTTLMYALSVAFIVFVTVAFDIQITSMEYSDRRNKGAEVVAGLAFRRRPLGSAEATGDDAYEEGILDPQYDDVGRVPGVFSSDSSSDSAAGQDDGAPPYKDKPAEPLFYELNYGGNFYLSDYLQLRKEMAPLLKAGVISAMTYRGAALLPVAWNLQYLFLQTPGRYQNSDWSIAAVPPNFYNTINSAFTIVNRYSDDTSRFGLSEALYTGAGLRKMILATTTYRTFSFPSLSSPGLCRSGLRLNESAATSPVNDTARAFSTSAVMDSSAVFLMTKFANKLGDIVTSFPALAYYSGIPFLSVQSMPLRNVYFRVPRKRDYARVKAAVSRFMGRNGFYPRMEDVETSMEDIRTANMILVVFFIFTLLMILVICFFSLMSGMSANVLDSSKEIAVLLCMGMSHFQLYRVYIWEAFILVLASGLLGLIVGTVVAYTMQMQNVLFTQLSIPFGFPYIQLCIIIVVGLVSALVASVGPVSYLLHLPSVTHILRRTVH